MNPLGTVDQICALGKRCWLSNFLAAVFDKPLESRSVRGRSTCDRSGKGQQTSVGMALASSQLRFVAPRNRSESASEYGANASLHSGDDTGDIAQAVGDEKRDAGGRVATLVMGGEKAA
jgi:hypothetical protein